MTSYIQDPDATLDYAFDWTNWLQAGETISTFTVTATTGVTIAASPAPALTGNVVTYWLTGGVDGKQSTVTCHITTSAGRQDDRSDQVYIRSM